MLHIRTQGLICAVRQHGEHHAIVRILTPEHGLIAGYVRGWRSRQMRPILMPGNAVAAELSARAPDQLAGMTVELTTSRGPWHNEPLAAAALEWGAAVTAATLPEEQDYPRLYTALSGLFDAICLAPSARGWAEALVRYELLLLEELGFGLDLSHCAATGKEGDLAFVSPKSAAAVSRGAAVGYEAKLLPLPAFLLTSAHPDWPDLLAGLSLTEYFLSRNFFADRRQDIMATRTVLIDRLKRAVA